MGKAKNNCRRRNGYLNEKFLDLDRYSYPVGLNVNGHTSIRSHPGSITTLVLFTILVCYGIIKL